MPIAKLIQNMSGRGQIQLEMKLVLKDNSRVSEKKKSSNIVIVIKRLEHHGEGAC